MQNFGISIAAILCASCVISLLLLRNWRFSLALLGAHYLFSFFLYLSTLPFSIAAAKLVIGLMAVTILGISQPENESNQIWAEGIFLRLFAAGMITLATLASLPVLSVWLADINPALIWGGAILIGVSFLQIGMTDQIQKVIFALLTLLTGFEILYSAVENAILVEALLATITLGLALSGAYLLLAEKAEA